MPNFEPNSIIKIGNVPFDNSYRHTMTFASRQSQYEFFSECCSYILEKSNYTYVRMNNAIRVPFNAEILYTYDYVMYQNANYGNKWFYAFIVAVNYVNENMTELVLELDVMQTWYFDYSLKQGFVEREHVNDDSLFAHLNPEPAMPFNLICQSKFRCPDFHDSMALVQTSSTPKYTGAYDPTAPEGSALGNQAVGGGVYSNILNGAAYYVFDPSEITSMGSDSNFLHFLIDMNGAGAAASISNIFMFPKRFLAGSPYDDGYQTQGSSSDSWRNFRLETGKSATVRPYTFDMPTSLDGYVPKNNKCFIYPYNYMVVEDNAGHRVELKYELWQQVEQHPSGEYKFVLQCFVPVDPDATAFVVPTQYDGESTNYENALTFPCTAKCSWVYSAYQTWSAQNHLANTLNGLAGTAMLAVPAAKGISATTAALGVGLRSAARIEARGGIAATNRAIARSSLEHGMSQVTNREAYTGMLGAGQLGHLAANIDRQSKVPDVVKGSASGNSLYGVLQMTFNAKNMCMQREFVEIFDNFLSMYGYQVDVVKIPNRTGRRSWNYVKMQNSCHRGSVPASDMDKINSIYDTGITFWHTSDVGNYSLDNSII